MQPEQLLSFGSFRLDVTDGRLWRGGHVMALRPRSMAVLRYLVEHPGRLVTKAELRGHVWGETHVTDTVLRVCVREIRAALGDTASAPQYVQTVGQEGYRFLGGGDHESSPLLRPGPLVGRRHEVERLEEWFQRASNGQHQLGFISAEAGVGKTTVVDLFLERLVARGGIRVARVQGVEHYGEGEPYLPWLEALGQLARGPRGSEVLAAVRRYAPMWLIQLPGLVSEPELERLQRQVQGATPARMVRELAEVLDVLAAEATLVLVLEDLHWSDLSSLECLANLARRRQSARLLILGTYRAAEVVIRGHPLRGLVQELCGMGQAEELRLEVLPVEDVAAYVAGRLGGSVTTALAAFIYERTDGNPLFMVNMLEHLVQQRGVVRLAEEWTLRLGSVALTSVPAGVRQLLVRRIEELAPEVRRVLEAASVMGESFTVAAVAAGVQSAAETVDAICEGLAAQHYLLADTGLTVWPDETRSGSYRFLHGLYQQVLYEQLGAGRRAQLHWRIGERLETGYGARVREVAAQLAVHFERGGEARRGIQYLQQVAENAAQRNALPESIAALRKGLALLATLADSPERTQQEFALQLFLAELLMTAQGMGAPEAGEAYTRAHVLWQQLGERPLHFRLLSGLTMFHATQGRLGIAQEFGRQLFNLALSHEDPILVREGSMAMGVVALYRGDFIAARAHLEQSLELSPLRPHMTSMLTAELSPGLVGGLSPRIASLVWLMRALWGLGYVDQAQRRSQEAVGLARDLGHAPSIAYAQYFAAVLSQCRRDPTATHARADALMAFATEQGLQHRIEQGRVLRGWALAMQGNAAAGVQQIQQGLAVHQDIGIVTAQPYYLALLAEASGLAAQPETGLKAVAEGLRLLTATEQPWWKAELYRLQGDLLLRLPNPDIPQAESCFQRALEVAHGQQAKALELRAALSCARLWQCQGKRDGARQLLVDIYRWFTEGFDTPDLKEAKALLGDLA